MLTALLLLACQTPEDPAALWPTDPVRAQEILRGLDDPLEREGAVARILEAHPEASLELCGLLSPGPGLERCEKLRARPHLWTPATQRAPARQDRTRLRLPDSFSHRWESLRPDPGDCTQSSPECLSEAARALAASGQPGDAAARCLSNADERWRMECFFRTAEAVADGPTRTEDSLSLCASAGTYLEMCVGHVLLGLQSDDWAQAPARAAALRATLGDDAAPILALFWCQAAHRVLERHPEQFATVRNPWGEDAAPHLRSALALAVIEAPDPFAAYQAVLAGATPPALVVDEDRASARLLWHRDFPGEETIDAIPMLHNGADRRATVSDPTLDGQLAVLSALGHARSPDLDRIAGFLDDPEPLLRWTAARLLSQLSPDHPALQKAAADTDARVRARSKQGFAPHESRNKARGAQP